MNRGRGGEERRGKGRSEVKEKVIYGGLWVTGGIHSIFELSKKKILCIFWIREKKRKRKRKVNTERGNYLNCINNIC